MKITCSSCHYTAETETPWHECPKCRSRLYAASVRGEPLPSGGGVSQKVSGDFSLSWLSVLLLLVMLAGGVGIYHFLSASIPPPALPVSGGETVAAKVMPPPLPPAVFAPQEVANPTESSRREVSYRQSEPIRAKMEREAEEIKSAQPTVTEKEMSVLQEEAGSNNLKRSFSHAAHEQPSVSGNRGNTQSLKKPIQTNKAGSKEDGV